LKRLRLELETERAARENAEARAESLAGDLVGVTSGGAVQVESS
jgi:hypothetical protein